MQEDDLIGKVEEIARRHKSRQKQSAQPTRPDFLVIPEQAQLPFWPDSVRGMPNPLARSALFTVGNRNQARLHFKNKLISTLGGFKLIYRGEELRQEDLDVYLQILHIARGYALGEAVEFTAHSILSELEWGRGGDRYDRLRECLSRLSATALLITTENENKGFSGSLIRKFAWQGEDGNPMKAWQIWLEPELIRLFGHDMYTQVFWKQRRALKKPLSRWLHAYFYTHASPYPHKVDTLRGLSGSRAKSLADYRRQLRLALDELKKVNFLNHWNIDVGDLVQVARSPKPNLLSH